MKNWPSEDSLVREDCLLDKIRIHNLLMTNFQVFNFDKHNDDDECCRGRILSGLSTFSAFK